MMATLSPLLEKTAGRAVENKNNNIQIYINIQIPGIFSYFT